MVRFTPLRKYANPLMRMCFESNSFTHNKKLYSTNNLAGGIISRIKVGMHYILVRVIRSHFIIILQATGPITVEEYMRVVLTHPEKVN